MSLRNCCVKDCYNSGYQLQKWRKKYCNIHYCNFGTSRCICSPPFTLFGFPTELKDPYARNIWIKNINRLAQDGKTIWVPTADSRICSEHFIDKQTSLLNQYPTLNLGHNSLSIVKKSRPPPLDRSCIPTPSKKVKLEDQANPSIICQFENLQVLETQEENISNCQDQNAQEELSNSSHNVMTDHDYISQCIGCNVKDEEIRNLRIIIKKLEEKLQLQNAQSTRVKSTYRSNLYQVFKSDKSCKFYTGIPTVASFNALFKLIEPKFSQIRHWKGPKHVIKYKKFIKSGPKRFLSPKEEMVLTLMKLRLGLLNQDLEDRFNISAAHVSRIFTTWIKLLDGFFGSLVFNPSKDVVQENLPPSFQSALYNTVRHIVDCTEVFLEKPQNLEIKTKTWSDYKHHHTGKFLISITPSGFINYLSKTWGGRTSDKYITDYCGFLDIIEQDDTVMADRGFQILDELTRRQAYLLVPPGRRGAVQMTAAEVNKTKKIANRRIYVEQAIRRMKCLRILKFELPVSLIHHLDYIVHTVAGICNLYKPLPKY